MKTSVLKNTFGTTLIFYFLIGFEFIYMATPVAAYFYSVYRPALDFLDNYPSLAWITGFFLPHLAEDTKSVFINSLKPAGLVIAAAGLLIFLICAFQVYYSKLMRKGIVTGGLYKYTRHPQYTGFMMWSFGLLILWPRYLVLIMFITLAFVYHLLAEREEKECELRFGDQYLQYKDSTGMFFPKLSLPSVFKNNNYRQFQKIILRSALYIFLIIISVQIADFLKSISADSLYSAKRGNQIFLSIFKQENREIQELINVLDSAGITVSIMKRSNDRFINYIIPADMYLSEIPMIKDDNAANHMLGGRYSKEEIKIITVKTKSRNDKTGENEILLSALSLEPVYETWINIRERRITKFIPLSVEQVRYKNIPEPVF